MSCVPHRTYQFEQWIDENLGVSIRGSQIKLDGENDAKDLVEQINASKNLKYLELEGNTLGVDGAKAIGKALESKPEFEAALWKDLFTGRLKDEIPQAMRYLFAGIDMALAHLQRLDLSDNAIGPVGMAGLAPFFKSPCSFSLKELICNNNGLGPEGGSMFAQALSNCYDASVKAGGEVFQLKVFVCGRNRMENKAGTAIAGFFEKIKSLEEIHMPQNGIYTPGMNAISKALRHNKNLKVINFNDNTIRPDGSVELAETIYELANLEELNLGDCLLKDKGSMNIVNALRDSKNFQSLILESNEIGKQTGLDLSSILRTIPSNLLHVNLSYNEFGYEAIDDMCQVLCEVPEVIIDDDLGEREDGEGSDGDGDGEETEENEDEDGDYEDVDDEEYDEEGVYESEIPYQEEEQEEKEIKIVHQQQQGERPIPSIFGGGISRRPEAENKYYTQFQSIFSEAQSKGNMSITGTQLLVSLGVLKDEDKKRVEKIDDQAISGFTKFVEDANLSKDVVNVLQAFINESTCRNMDFNAPSTQHLVTALKTKHSKLLLQDFNFKLPI